jgi:hypothetical protein
MRLGGWSRIGIVLSVLYGLLVAFFAYDTRPRLEYMEGAWLSDASDVIAQAISKAENKEVQSYQVRQALLKESNAENIAWLEQVAVSPSANQRKFSSAVAQVNAKHKALIAELPSQQRQHWLFAFAWWAGGTALVFALGWTAGWIYRGFRQHAA